MQGEGTESEPARLAENTDEDPGVRGKVPSYTELMRPLLGLLADGNKSRLRDLTDGVADQLGIPPKARAVTLKSGQTVVYNRTAWAMTSLAKAEMVDRVGPNTFRITDAGRALLGTASTIDDRTLAATSPSFLAWLAAMGQREVEEPENRTTTVWLVRAGEKGAYVSGFLSARAVVVGWGETGDLTGLNREDVVERVATTFPSDAAAKRTRVANTLLQLTTSIHEGDFVVMPDSPSRTVVVGQVTGPYRYLEDPFAPDYQHAREVHWFSRVPLSELSYGARNEMWTGLTLSRPGHQRELVLVAESHRNDPVPQPIAQSTAAPATEMSAPVAIPLDASFPVTAAFSQFSTNPLQLMHMLDQLHTGEIALPDFQRSFVWAPDATRELIVSMMRSFPAGNLLFLRGGSKRFKPRLAEGAPPSPLTPSYLVLDGQQRLTSLYQAIFGVGQWRYFIDLGALLAGSDIDESVRIVAADHVGALTTVEAQANALMMPLTCVRNGGSISWIHSAVKVRKDDDEDRAWSVLHQLQQAYVAPLLNYAFPVTILPEATHMEAICTIFQTLNRTGRPLTPFELISGAFADGLSLRDRWTKARAQHPILDDFSVDPYYVLQVVALRADGQCRRRAVLNLSTDAIESGWDAAVTDMVAVLNLLRSECGVLVPRWLPYRPMLVPLAYAWREVVLAPGPDKGARRSKLMRWFWCASFRGEYESSSATLAERDAPALQRWLAGAEEPEAVREFTWNPEEWRKVTPRQQGLYRATMALALCEAPRDFHRAAPLTAQTIDADKIDDHHVFPRGYLQSTGHDGEPDSVLNHVLIDRDTNIRIGKRAPSDYLSEICSSLGAGLFASVLSSQQLPFESDGPLLQDDLEGFLDWRLERLSDLLAQRTGVEGPASLPTPSHLRSLDRRIEDIELRLRELIRSAVAGEGATIPSHIEQKVRERFLTDQRRHPGPTPNFVVYEQMQYFDLRDLQDTITSKALWPHFAHVFGAKDTLSWRFGQLADLRNAIRHSRQVTPVIRNDGEAAVGWFRGAIDSSVVTDRESPVT